MIRSGMLGLVVLGAIALLPADAGAEVITPHPVTPTVVTTTVAPAPVPTPAASAAPAPGPSTSASTPAPLPSLPPGPQPSDNESAQRSTWVPSSKPGWEGVKETHDAIERDMGGDLLHQTLTEISSFQEGVDVISEMLDSLGWGPTLAPGTLPPDGGGHDPYISVQDVRDLPTDPGISLSPANVLFGAHGADPGGIKEIIDGVFGTSMSDQLKRLKKQ